jgi:DNA processing protein
MKHQALLPVHPAYPDQLTAILGGRTLHAFGFSQLMSRPAIGICGSRNASASALKWAYEFGREAANHGIVVVSGFARGVDRQAHIGALEGGGATIAVLPEGINHLRLVRELKPLADPEKNFLAISMFEPDAPWAVWQAMERNKLIVGLSVGLFVIEARERGGTIDAAYEAVRQGKRLWAIAYKKNLPSREGNRKLLATSAIPLKHTGDLKQALEEAMTKPPPEVKQLVMSLAGPLE